MNNQGKLYTSGLKPVFYQSPDDPVGQNFKRIPGKINFSYADDGFKMSFYHTFTFTETELKATETPIKTYFAFTYPFSY